MDETDARLEARADALVESDRKLLAKLVAMRKSHHLSQEDIADRMGVSQPTVAAFERYDANPTLATIRRYAMAVGAIVHHSLEDDCVEHSTHADTSRARSLPDTAAAYASIMPNFRDTFDLHDVAFEDTFSLLTAVVLDDPHGSAYRDHFAPIGLPRGKRP